jgi:hypothetical protein
MPETGDMNEMTITRKSSAVDLDATVKRNADGGPIVTRDGYTVISPADWLRLLQLIDDQIDAREFEIAWRRRNEPEGATLDELRANMG